jgi:hydroxymethylbilane synthase
MSKSTRLKIGTRGSKLAVRQASWVAQRLRLTFREVEVSLVTIRTSGDKILHSPLAMVGGKGLFVKEIEEALMAGQVDLAVHSVKDIPAEISPGLVLSAVTQREDPRDALVTRQKGTLAELPLGAKVGTSSLRRRAQLLCMRRDLQVVPLRGNVDTRMRKLERGELDAIVLAAAALRRLGFQEEVAEFLSVEDFVPAVGQGALAVETREGDEAVSRLVRVLDHPESRLCVEAERAFMTSLGGGCQVPAGAYASKEGEELELRGMLAAPDGDILLKDKVRGAVQHGRLLGEDLAQRILERGGRELLAALGADQEPRDRPAIAGPAETRRVL